LAQIAWTQLLQLASSLSPGVHRSWAQPPGALLATGAVYATAVPSMNNVAAPAPTTWKSYASVNDGMISPCQIAEYVGPYPAGRSIFDGDGGSASLLMSTNASVRVSALPPKLSVVK